MVDTVRDSASENHWFRMVFPFEIDAKTLLADDPLLAPFSQLKGNLSITDVNGNHLPGIVCINGKDYTGKDRSGETGFPIDAGPDGQNLNVNKQVLVYIADVDENLSTGAPFGFWNDINNPNKLIEPKDVIGVQDFI